MNNKDEVVVNNIRGLAIDMIDEAKSGHPGIALGAAPIVYTLYANHLRFSSTDDKWINRDRFVLSAGHASSLLYATLYACGFDLSLNDLKSFRRIDSKTPGHPELHKTPGVDAPAGVLGQGIASAVGIALGERYLNSYLKKHDVNSKLINYYTYALVGDGDLMEGVSYEACSLAGTQKLGKLIVLYDSNDVSLDGKTDLTFNENVIDRYKAMGWHTLLVKNGENLTDINDAIEKAKKEINRPSLIEIKTTIGYGSFNAGKNIVHGKPLSKEDILMVKEKLKLSKQAFDVNEEALGYLREKINYRMNNEYTAWAKNYSEIINSNDAVYNNLLQLLKTGEVNVNFNDIKLDLTVNHKEELRLSCYRIMSFIASKTPFFIGGAADVASSTKAYINIDESMSHLMPLGKDIFFGVREAAMGAILNGLAIAGLRPFGSTFFVFSDYIKPMVRISAMYNLPVTYIFTHDSISIGEDGPTHQPVEQMAGLRSIPNLKVFHPADIIELVGCFQQAMISTGPVAIVVSKNEATLVPNTNNNFVKHGAYVVRMEKEKLDGILISSGTDVKTCYYIAEELYNEGMDLRVVSMPSSELYIKNNKEFQNKLLPDVKKIIISSHSSDSWHKIVQNDEMHITINEFGYSGKKDEVLTKMNFSYEQIKSRIKKIMQ